MSSSTTTGMPLVWCRRESMRCFCRASFTESAAYVTSLICSISMRRLASFRRAAANGGQAVRTQNIKHFVHDLGRHADRRQAEQTKAEKTELLHVSICLRLRGSNLRKVSDIAMQIPAVNHSPIIIYRLSFTINSYLCTVKLKL